MAEVVPVMLSNLAYKMVKIPKEGEVGRALPLRSIQQLRYEKVGQKGPDRLGEVKDKIVAPEKFRARIGCLLSANHDVVVNSKS